jgi:1-deoxy-D-xylulose-5-phosphate reductoisomerase
LDFEAPDETRFPCLSLAYEAVRAAGTMPAVLNAANEVAVASFLDLKIRFTHIPEIIRHCMTTIAPEPADTIEAVLEADRIARLAAESYVNRLAAR